MYIYIYIYTYILIYLYILYTYIFILTYTIYIYIHTYLYVFFIYIYIYIYTPIIYIPLYLCLNVGLDIYSCLFSSSPSLPHSPINRRALSRRRQSPHVPIGSRGRRFLFLSLSLSPPPIPIPNIPSHVLTSHTSPRTCFHLPKKRGGGGVLFSACRFAPFPLLL
jgi:hypothetical protein